MLMPARKKAAAFVGKLKRTRPFISTCGRQKRRWIAKSADQTEEKATKGSCFLQF